MNGRYLFYPLSLIRTMIYFLLYAVFFKIFVCNICPCFSPFFCLVLLVPICCIYLSCFVITIFKFYFFSIFINGIFLFFDFAPQEAFCKVSLYIYGCFFCRIFSVLDKEKTVNFFDLLFPNIIKSLISIY